MNPMSCGASADEYHMRNHTNGSFVRFVRLDADVVSTHGARCMDGSPGGFYFARDEYFERAVC